MAKDGIQGHMQNYYIHLSCQVWEEYSVSMKATFGRGEVGFQVFCGKAVLKVAWEGLGLML